MPEITPVGEMDLEATIAYLRAIGDTALADELQAADDDAPVAFGLLDSVWPLGKTPAWKHPRHLLGFIGNHIDGSDDFVPIESARSVVPETRLRQAPIRITLDALHIADYPGGGEHELLIGFSALNQAGDTTEAVEFALGAKVREGSATIAGWPIFVGLYPGAEGVALACRVLAVKNSRDDQIMGVLSSDLFKNGLALAATAQPAIGVVGGLMTGIFAALAASNKNVVVQDIKLGLDFAGGTTRVALAEGAYFALQVPENHAGWQGLRWSRSQARLVDATDGTTGPGLNYLVFSVSKMNG